MEGAWAVVHDLFEIVGGLAAAIAVGFSVWITSRERADRKQAERDRDEARAAQRRAELEERRREQEAQARRIVVTLSKQYPAGRWTVRHLVTWRNYSDMPITDVAPVLMVSDTVPGEPDFFQSLYRSVMLPNDEVTANFGGSDGWNPRRYGVRFRDAAGRRWIRTADGELMEAQEWRIVDTEE